MAKTVKQQIRKLYKDYDNNLKAVEDLIRRTTPDKGQRKALLQALKLLREDLKNNYKQQLRDVEPQLLKKKQDLKDLSSDEKSTLAQILSGRALRFRAEHNDFENFWANSKVTEALFWFYQEHGERIAEACGYKVRQYDNKNPNKNTGVSSGELIFYNADFPPYFIFVNGHPMYCYSPEAYLLAYGIKATANLSVKAFHFADDSLTSTGSKAFIDGIFESTSKVLSKEVQVVGGRIVAAAKETADVLSSNAANVLKTGEIVVEGAASISADVLKAGADATAGALKLNEDTIKLLVGAVIVAIIALAKAVQVAAKAVKKAFSYLKHINVSGTQVLAGLGLFVLAVTGIRTLANLARDLRVLFNFKNTDARDKKKAGVHLARTIGSGTVFAIIGTFFLPGIGTLVGAVFGAWFGDEGYKALKQLYRKVFHTTNFEYQLSEKAYDKLQQSEGNGKKFSRAQINDIADLLKYKIKNNKKQARDDYKEVNQHRWFGKIYYWTVHLVGRFLNVASYDRHSHANLQALPEKQAASGKDGRLTRANKKNELRRHAYKHNHYSRLLHRLQDGDKSAIKDFYKHHDESGKQKQKAKSGFEVEGTEKLLSDTNPEHSAGKRKLREMKLKTYDSASNYFWNTTEHPAVDPASTPAASAPPSEHEQPGTTTAFTVPTPSAPPSDN